MEKNWNHPENFAEYLTGLYEGDGNLYCGPEEAKVTMISFTLTGHVKDKPLFEKIQAMLSKGTIYQVKNKNTIVLKVGDTEGICYIIELIRPFLRTPKYLQVNKIINYLNQRKSLQIHPVNKSNIPWSKANWWLCGFFEAEAHFQIESYQPADGNIQFRFCFEVEQSLLDKTSRESKKEFMQDIATLFNMRIYFTKKNCIRIRTKSPVALKVLFEFFQSFPLQGLKCKDFLDFQKAFYFNKAPISVLDNKESLILSIKSQMNANRIS